MRTAGRGELFNHLGVSVPVDYVIYHNIPLGDLPAPGTSLQSFDGEIHVAPGDSQAVWDLWSQPGNPLLRLRLESGVGLPVTLASPSGLNSYRLMPGDRSPR